MRALYIIGRAIVVLLLVVVLVALAIQAAVPSFGQAGQCGPRAAVVAHLAAKYGETRRSVGMAANSTLMEVFASTATGSWTITVTTAGGMTCLVASGESFEPVDEPAPATGIPG